MNVIGCVRYGVSIVPFVWRDLQRSSAISKILQCSSRQSSDQDPFFMHVRLLLINNNQGFVGFIGPDDDDINWLLILIFDYWYVTRIIGQCSTHIVYIIRAYTVNIHDYNWDTIEMHSHVTSCIQGCVYPAYNPYFAVFNSVAIF